MKRYLVGLLLVVSACAKPEPYSELLEFHLPRGAVRVERSSLCSVVEFWQLPKGLETLSEIRRRMQQNGYVLGPSTEYLLTWYHPTRHRTILWRERRESKGPVLELC